VNVLHDFVPQVAAQIETVDESYYMVAIKMHKAYEDTGIVLVYRPRDDSWITWEWSTKSSGGSQALLYQGHYDMDYDEGMMDFEARGR
jgi:hypothetical protein